MRPGIHPEYKRTLITCACGRVSETRATVDELHVEICSHCHPFFTGRQKLVDTAGRVERFRAKYGSGGGPAPEPEEAETPVAVEEAEVVVAVDEDEVAQEAGPDTTVTEAEAPATEAEAPATEAEAPPEMAVQEPEVEDSVALAEGDEPEVTDAADEETDSTKG